MTTKITVDAHAGWPVLVVLLKGESGLQNTCTENVVVKPFTKQDFFVHSGLKILLIEELSK